jgi:hypothetical protein
MKEHDRLNRLLASAERPDMEALNNPRKHWLRFTIAMAGFHKQARASNRFGQSFLGDQTNHPHADTDLLIQEIRQEASWICAEAFLAPFKVLLRGDVGYTSTFRRHYDALYDCVSGLTLFHHRESVNFDGQNIPAIAAVERVF